MPTAVWVIAPYTAVLSFLIGSVWRRRRSRTRPGVAAEQGDHLHQAGRILLRFGVVLVLSARIAEVFATRSHPGAIPAPILYAEAVTAPLAVLGAGLILLPDLLGPSPQRPVTPVDRITLPLLTVGLLSGILAEFDDNPTDAHNPIQDTLFVWLPAAFTAHPHPHVMVTAPVVVQVRALAVLTFVAIWPYTRLAGIITAPITEAVRRITGAAARRREARYAPPAPEADEIVAEPPQAPDATRSPNVH